MKLFGYLMVLSVIQLFVMGSQIQRGNASLIPGFCLRSISEENLLMYCRRFGNHLLTLGIIAAVCAWLSLTAASITMTPILLFGAGLILVLILILMDTKRFSQ